MTEMMQMLEDQRRDDYEKASVSLHLHLESRIKAVEKENELTAKTLEVRLHAMNGLHMLLTQQAKDFISREAYQLSHALIQKQVDDLRISRAVLEGKASQNTVMVSVVLAVAGLLTAVLGLALNFFVR